MPPKRQKWVGADLHKGTLFGTGALVVPGAGAVAVAGPFCPHGRGQEPGLGRGRVPGAAPPVPGCKPRPLEPLGDTARPRGRPCQPACDVGSNSHSPRAPCPGWPRAILWGSPRSPGGVGRFGSSTAEQEKNPGRAGPHQLDAAAGHPGVLAYWCHWPWDWGLSCITSPSPH